MVSLTGSGTYAVENTFEPIDWSRGVRRKIEAGKRPTGPDAGKAEDPLGSPRSSIVHQFNLLKEGKAEELRGLLHRSDPRRPHR